jgi:hypothetical protein
MTVIWHGLSYERHIPVISLDPTWCHIDGTYRHIPVIWHRELTSHMNYIWQFMPVIWLVAWEQAAPGAPARSRIALEMQRHRVWIARVFIVPVHHSTRRCHWAAVTASLGQPAPQWTQVVTRATDVGGSGGVAPPPPPAGVSHRCRRRRRWPQSRTADVGSSGSVVTPPGSTSSRL